MTTPAGPAAEPRLPGLRIGRVLGVPVHVNYSWFLFAAFVLLTYGPALQDDVGAVRAYSAAAAFALLLGLSVLLHEVGHCVVARAFDLPVRSITITLLAGFTEITEPPQTPAREYSVAVAGPMVSLLLCGVGVAALPLFEEDSAPWLIASVLALSNGIVAVFNLLPGLPLDGGRVLRSVVWRLGADPETATRVAAWAGRVVAVLVVPLVIVVALPAAGVTAGGLQALLFSALLSAFIYLGASAALRQSRVATRLPAVTVRSLVRPAIAVPSSMPLSEAVRRAHEAGAHGLVVVDGADRLEAVVSEAAVVATPEERRPWVTVGTLARHLADGMVLDPSLAGEDLLVAMRRAPASEYVVRDPDTGWLGVLSASDVAKAVVPG